MIIGVAVKSGDIVLALPKPNRHADCIKVLMDLPLDKSLEYEWGKSDNQGFIDEFGRYYTRPQAAQHAYECGQINRLMNGLISEDLW